jgi:hypothetical protein
MNIMRHDTEENLFNSSFRDQFYYIFKNQEFYSIVQFISKYPLSLKTEYSSKNLTEILQKGAELAKKNGRFFINDTIFS